MKERSLDKSMIFCVVVIIEFISSTCLLKQLAQASKILETLVSLMPLSNHSFTPHPSDICFNINIILVPVIGKINGASFAKWKKCTKEHTMLVFSHQIIWSTTSKKYSRKY